MSEGNDIVKAQDADAAAAEAAAAAAASGVDTNTDKSQGGDSPANYLAAVEKALEKPGAEGAPDSAAKASEDEAVKAAAEKEAAEKAAADEAAAKAAEEAEANKPEALKAQIAELEPRAKAFDQFVGFMEKADLNSEEVNAGMAIMAAMKAEPARALEMLRPYVDALERAVGETLPDDLQKAVDEGHVTEALARELAQARGQAATATQAAQRVTEQTSQRAAAQVAQMNRNAATQWETEQKQSDPDWSIKAPHVQAHVAARIRAEGRYPNSPQEAVKWLNEARTAVNDLVGKVRPAGGPTTRPTLPVGGAGPAKAAPKNHLEALEAGLEAAHAR